MTNPWVLIREVEILDVPIKVYTNATDSTIMFSFHTNPEKGKVIEDIIKEHFMDFDIDADFARDITNRN